MYFFSEIGYEDSQAIHEFTPTFYHQTVKDAYENSVRGFGPFLANHLDTMVQRGPDNIDGAKATSEVRKMSILSIFGFFFFLDFVNSVLVILKILVT